MAITILTDYSFKIFICSFMCTTMALFSSPSNLRFLSLTSRHSITQIRKEQKHFILFSASSASSSVSSKHENSLIENKRIKIFKEQEWRMEAKDYAEKVVKLLEPGLICKEDNNQLLELDSYNPIYNFLIHYYNIRGTKGIKRLCRWCPDSSKDFQFFLENAREEDFHSLLHKKGSHFITVQESNSEGVIYLGRKVYKEELDSSELKKKASGYTWYRTILKNTLSAPPILHCFNLHEWAMVYHPKNAPPPPSTKFQNHLPLRVDQETINQAVESRKNGLCCTHYDAMRFFAPLALNFLQTTSVDEFTIDSRKEIQPKLEQPACVHAQMDLLKITLKLLPFCSSNLLLEVLDLAIQARKLDVAASPYDASSFGLDFIPIETEEGRKIYKEKQAELMIQGQIVRKKLLDAYDLFLQDTFDEDILDFSYTSHCISCN